VPEGGSSTVTLTTNATVPWQPASEVSDVVGLSIALFGYPGSGKTTFGAGKDSLIVDLEGGTEVLADRSDVMVWPRKNNQRIRKEPTWPEVQALSSQLLTKKHPFRVIQWDTVTKLQNIVLKHIVPGMANGTPPGLQEYGKANTLIIDLIEKWCAHARENNIAVVFAVHAKEVKDEDSGVLHIRMDLTPGVQQAMNREVSHIAYIEEFKAQGGKPSRRLQFGNTAKVTAKFRQPQSGPQLPQTIDGDKVSLDYLLKFREDARKARAASK
jgi:hypothetical protein